MSDPNPAPGQKPTLNRQSFYWSAGDRRILLVLLFGLLGYLVFRYVLNPVHVSDPQPRQPARFFDLADRIDPNTAQWQELAALPNIGEKRAKEIIAYREKFTVSNPGRRAFDRAEDLLNIKGFGFAIVTQLRPYLIFPGTEGPATISSS